MGENEKQIQELRTQFLSKLDDLDSDTFHTADINRVKSDDNYLKRFILHHDGNQDSAFNMLWETCEWRKKFGTNDITEKNVNMNILELGSIYPFGKDKDGKTLLVFKSKKHFKGAYDFEDQKRCLVYWMERLERQENGEKISLLFDMDGATLSNMDMEYTKYLIGLFKNYYPHFLNYIIIFEMAWVLNAVFKVIKSLLPPKAVEKMKFVNKTSLKDYLDAEYSSKIWGAKDNYVFHFEPEEKSTIISPSISGEDSKKKVHFAEESFKHDQINESGFENSYTPVTTVSLGLKITPSDVMMFVTEGNEVASSLTLKNEDTHSILYKIKTTSPEKFRVRPSLGILAPGANASVNVSVFPSYRTQSLQKDKFLIMSIPTHVSDITQQEINDLWKQTNEKNVNQQRLRCCVPQTISYDGVMKNGAVHNSQMTNDQKNYFQLSSDITKLNTILATLKEELDVIKRQQRIIIIGFIILIFSLSYTIYADYFNSNTLRHNCWTESKSSHY